MRKLKVSYIQDSMIVPKSEKPDDSTESPFLPESEILWTIGDRLQSAIGVVLTLTDDRVFFRSNDSVHAIPRRSIEGFRYLSIKEMHRLLTTERSRRNSAYS